MNFDWSTSGPDFERNFAPLSPPDSYSLDADGLKLFLDKPAGRINTKGNVNDKVAEGATFNSTFTVRYGKVTYTMSGPAVPGVVTAAILIGERSCRTLLSPLELQVAPPIPPSHEAPERDEIDIELLGGDPAHWQTNVFAPAPHETQPLYSAFSSVEDYPHKPKSVANTHAYEIDWSPERIVWSVDGAEVRTLEKGDTSKNGALHYPTHVSRLQFGIWDASSPAGTSEWARGPIDWNKAPRRMSAVFESIQVECPYGQ